MSKGKVSPRGAPLKRVIAIKYSKCPKAMCSAPVMSVYRFRQGGKWRLAIWCANNHRSEFAAPAYLEIHY